MNILTFDLEDWYQLVRRGLTGELSPPRETIFRQTAVLLELLEQHHARATFFVLGMVAERYPQLVRRIAAHGHEIASHGYAHLRVYDLSPTEFANDTCRCRDLLQDIIGQRISGYRAPEFSINQRTLWAFEILAEMGFLYDSSIFPIYHRRYGIPDFHPAHASYRLASGRQIAELPLATLQLGRMRIPVAGGGYFRVLPLWLLRWTARRHEARCLPMITYFHPYEFDPVPLDALQTVHPGSWKRRIAAGRVNWRNSLGRSGVREKVSALLTNHRFTTCMEYLNADRSPENRTLLQPTCTSV